MKKGLLLMISCLVLSLAAYTQTIPVTFQVHNPSTTPVYVFGNWSGWSNWPGTPMTSIGNGTYETTIQLNTATTYEYLFVNGDTPAKEVLDPSWICTNGNAQYTNRIFTTGSAALTQCFDWASCNTCGSTVLTQVDLPVTFDNSNVNYALVDFGGNYSVIESDPVVAGNLVAKTIKGNTAELWAGTTIGGGAGFANAIPFAANATTITMRVYSPDAGIPVRMKVENPNDPTISVETEAITTMANAWETLTFNFANQAPGTAAINFANTYKKLSVFFNFGTTGAVAGTKTYYFDDIEFGAVTPSFTNVTFRVHNPSGTPVYVFGSWSNWVNWPGNPMTDIGNNTYEATIQLNTGASYEYLYVNGATPVKEVLNPAWSCTNGNGEYTNRTLTTSGASMVLCNNWASCDACGNPTPTTVNVTFRVRNPQTTPVFAFGNWSGWGNWPGNLMTNVGNNTYEVTIALLSGTAYEYLYVNGDNPAKEILDPTWPCTNGNTQYTNRMFTTGNTNSSFCNDWATCAGCDGVSISGTVTYMNSLSSPMSNTHVYLLHGSDTAATATTNSDGHYQFGNQPGGNYTIKAKTTKDWGGGNATDALLILKHFVGSAPLAGLFKSSADVDLSSFINSADALSVMKRFVGLQNAFPAGNWIYEHPSVSTLSGVAVNQAVNALCYGDVNASFVPEIKAAPGFLLERQGNTFVNTDGTVEIPVFLGNAALISALSLNLAYDVNSLDIKEIIPSAMLQTDENSVSLSYAANGNLNFAWFSLNKTVAANDLLFTIKARIQGQNPTDFTIGSASSCSDFSGINIQNASIIIPSFTHTSGDILQTSITPNPVSDGLACRLSIPESGRVTVRITSLTGQNILLLEDKMMESGSHIINGNLSGLQAGMYLVITSFEGQNMKSEKTDRIIRK